jgi:spore maturation protein CgeB
MLLTDWKTNLHEVFEIGKEVAAYRSTRECVELVNYYLANDKEREAIARAGQQRTLSEHSYYHRMQELTEILVRYLRN